jgi:hypothetical protein
MTETVDDAQPTFLQAPAACGEDLEQVDWTGTVPVRLADDLLLGVRFDNADLQQLVTEALGDRVAHEVENPTPFYSVRLGTAGRRKKAPLHNLLLGGRPVLSTRDLGRLVRGLGNHVSSHLTSEGYVVEAVPVAAPGGVVLVPTEVLAMGRVTDRLLLPAGFRMADVPRVVLDPAKAQVTVPEPEVVLSVPTARLEPIGATTTEETLPPGTYDLSGWLVQVPAPLVGPLRTVDALRSAAPLIHPPYPSGAQAALDEMRLLVEAVPMTGVTWITHDDLVTTVLEAGKAL